MLERLEQLEKAATPGPWVRGGRGLHSEQLVASFNKDGSLSSRHSGDHLPVFWDSTGRKKRYSEDCDLIAAARNALPALLAVARAAEGIFELFGRYIEDGDDPRWVALCEALAQLKEAR